MGLNCLLTDIFAMPCVWCCAGCCLCLVTDKVRTSFKLLLALARAVPVLNATPYTAACS